MLTCLLPGLTVTNFPISQEKIVSDAKQDIYITSSKAQKTSCKRRQKKMSELGDRVACYQKTSSGHGLAVVNIMSLQ